MLLRIAFARKTLKLTALTTVVALALAPTAALAQGIYTPPRTAEGHPDSSGT